MGIENSKRNMMRAYCEEAKRYGDIKLDSFHQPRHITVILNPVAKTRKGKALYEKFAAPIFHLSGLKVSLVVTEKEGEAKDLMEVMSNTDAVVIAGGNGSLHEAVTGMLRRNNQAVPTFPIGIIPIGKSNSIAKFLTNFQVGTSDVEFLAESAIAVVREILKPIDVMKIEGDKGKPVFALYDLNLGSIRDTLIKVDKYWYFGSVIKPYLAFWWNSLKSHEPIDQFHLSYSPACTGCSNCYTRFENEDQQKSIAAQTTRWWHAFLPRKTPDNNNEAKTPKIDYKSIINESCGKWTREYVENADNLLIRNTNESKLEVTLHPSKLTQKQFLQFGMNQYRAQLRYKEIQGPEDEGNNTSNKVVYQAQDVKIEFIDSNSSSNESISEGENNESNNSSSNDLNDNEVINIGVNEDAINIGVNEDVIEKQGEQTSPESDATKSSSTDKENYLSIDTEDYELQSLTVKLLPKRLKIYCGK